MKVKHVREEAGELQCPKCVYKNYSHCNHPRFKRRKLKPFIIAEEGTVYPPFCPLEKHEQADPLPGDAAPPSG